VAAIETAPRETSSSPSPATSSSASPATIEKLFEAQRRHQAAVKRTTADERVAKLKRLRAAIVAREQQIRDAIYKDFKKSPTEVELTEIYPSLVEIKDAVKHLHRWMKPEKVSTPLALLGTKSWIYNEPKGVVLIIGPWNYPFQLVISPLVAAVAAGNCVICKPSELTPHTSALLVELIRDVFPPEEVTVVEGGPAETQRLLALPFDHFFFTGSTRVGKIVAEAAAKHLSSTTLELGGKSPAILDDSADFATAADRLVWGKYVNAGQTCIAPDYVLVSERRQADLVGELKRSIHQMYGATDDAQKATPDFARIINERNYDRLAKMLDDTVAEGARVEVGGAKDASDRYIAPTVLSGVKPESPVMAEEIFGPILPILTFKNLDEVPAFVTARDKPLALYMFGKDQDAVASVVDRTTAGGTSINTTVIHFANTNLPFGGVGPSGLGSYHGKFGFTAFSHQRSVLKQGRPDMLKDGYPPYTEKTTKLINMLKKWFT
jgi:aldehyde dehydrogenase (NAD+)